MPKITLPDGNSLAFNEALTALDVAKRISSSLAKAAIAAKVNDKLVDLSTIIDTDANVAIITSKDADGLEVIRHSCAHLLAQAVQRIFPDAQVTIGPVIENGFYYDFSYPPGFTEDDLQKIEKMMQRIVKENLAVERHELSREEAIVKFSEMGEKYKVEIIKDLPESEILSFYSQGDFIDLCRGPHVPNTNKIKAFKLMHVAGAYWRGDSKNEMLQRIYGTAWTSKEELDEYLHQLEEAEKRDHRKLAKKLDLFHIQEEAPGMVFWHTDGWVVYQEICDYLRKILRSAGYQEIHTPQLVDLSLWQKSGHWDKFQEDMFSLQVEEREYGIKPMNCPCHVQVFKYGLKSYRDLPLRLAEFGSCHRNESSGALHGLMRLRNFVQDDAHIFCTEQQIQAEVSDFIDLLFKVYKHFGFENIIVKLSTRPEKRVGSDEVWDKAEAALECALNNKNLDWEMLPGEGAFYGPKLEFSLKDSIGRVWQCGTMQVDFSMPEKLGAQYIDENSNKATPVMLHRAILGSIERFFGILIEEYAGSLPLWLAPKQVAIMNITDKQAKYCQEIEKIMQNAGFRVFSDLRNEKIGFKIREHTIKRVPYLLVIGDKEVAEKQVAVRTRESKDLGVMSINDFIDKLNSELALV